MKPYIEDSKRIGKNLNQIKILIQVNKKEYKLNQNPNWLKCLTSIKMETR